MILRILFIKLLSDGNFEYIGRIDNLIKIRGIRVAPEEIEKFLSKYRKINECLVIKESNKKEEYLTAYYTSNTVIKPSDLYAYLINYLPKSIIPSYFVRLNEMPLTSNGKIDRKALISGRYIFNNKVSINEVPKTDLEIILLKIWQEILGIKRISLEDNFFSLGGHSLKIINVINRIKQELNIDISVKDFFRFSTISSLAKFIENNHFKNNLRLENQILIKENNKLIKGGIPFTNIKDYLLENKINSSRQLEIIKNQNIHPEILKETLLELPKLYPKLDLTILFRKKNTAIPVSKNEFKIAIIDAGKGHSEIKFIRDKLSIDGKLFTNILKNFQDLYNLKLIGKDYKKINSSLNKASFYVPQYSYPFYFDCWPATILAKIQWETDSFFYKSLLPALNFASLPNYYILDDKIKWTRPRNSQFLGYRDAISALGINYKILELKNQKEAFNYYNKMNQDNKPLLLFGSTYNLFFTENYKNKEFIAAELTRRNPLLSNISLFTGSLESDPIIHAVNLNYFGKIPINDFWEYWEGLGSKKEFKKFIKYGKSNNFSSFRTLDIQNIEKIKPFKVEMLYQALSFNVREFYKNKIVKGNKSIGFKKIYFGRQVLEIFKKDIISSFKKKNKSTPDVVILDLIKRLDRSYFFLRDLIQDICRTDKYFIVDLKKINQLIKKWQLIDNILSTEASKKRLDYRFKISRLPNPSFYKFRFLSNSYSKDVIYIFDKILDLQEEIYKSIYNKLKKRKYDKNICI